VIPDEAAKNESQDAMVADSVRPRHTLSVIDRAGWPRTIRVGDSTGKLVAPRDPKKLPRDGPELNLIRSGLMRPSAKTAATNLSQIPAPVPSNFPSAATAGRP
jgi:hypothetical protein